MGAHLDRFGHRDGAGQGGGVASDLGMSYRRAWMLVDTMNRCFVEVEDLVTTNTGGAA